MTEQTTPNLTPSPAEPVPAEYDLLCESCGYSLVGLTGGNRCPECGNEFDPNVLPLARVPWLYRKRLGGWQAYWLTVGKIMRDPGGFAQELCRPVRISAVDAKLFRQRTVRRAVLTLMMPIFGIVAFVIGNSYFRLAPVNFAEPNLAIFVRGTTLAAAVGMFSWVLLTWATDLPTFIWSGTGENSHELSPIQHYAAAPLALTPLMVIAVTVVGVLSSVFSRRFDPTLTVMAFGITTMLLLIYLWRTSAVLMRVATGCSRRRMLALVLYLPVHWLLIAVIAFVMGMIAAGVVRLIFSPFNIPY